MMHEILNAEQKCENAHNELRECLEKQWPIGTMVSYRWGRGLKRFKINKWCDSFNTGHFETMYKGKPMKVHYSKIKV